MTRIILTGASAIALAVAWNSTSTAQTRDEPRQDRPQAGQEQQAGQEGQAGQQQERQAGQQTIRGRITAIELAGQAGDRQSQSQAGLPGRSDSQGQAGPAVRATITVQGGGMMGRPSGPGGATEPGAAPGDETGREGQPQDRPDAGQPQDRPDLGQGEIGRSGSGPMMTYQFTVNDNTLIEADDADRQSGRPGAADRPGTGRQSDQPGRQSDQPDQQPDRVGENPLASPAGQPARQEYRGLRAGQYVEVTYRPDPRAGTDRPGQPGEADRPSQDQPLTDQLGQDPTNREADRPGLGDRAGQGRMMRGEAISIRVLPETDQDRPGSELDRPGAGNVDPARPGQERPGQGTGTGQPEPSLNP